jgi:hypothetical protein
VSLGGRFGALALGRQYTPGYLLTSEIDPFASVTVGQYNNVYLTEYRWNNQIGYVSPNWGGFSVAAGYTLNGYGQESPGNRGLGAAGDVHALSVVPQYRNGPLLVGLHLQELRAKSTGKEADGSSVPVSYDGKKVRVFDFGGTYDLGPIKLAASYGVRRADVADFSADTGASPARTPASGWSARRSRWGGGQAAGLVCGAAPKWSRAAPTRGPGSGRWATNTPSPSAPACTAPMRPSTTTAVPGTTRSPARWAPATTPATATRTASPPASAIRSDPFSLQARTGLSGWNCPSACRRAVRPRREGR